MTIPRKPARMSETRYRELYDSVPQLVIVDGHPVATCCGPISAEVVAATYRKEGHRVQVREA